MTVSQLAAAIAANALRISSALTELQSSCAEKASLDLIVPTPDLRYWRATVPSGDGNNWVLTVNGVSFANTTLADLLNSLGIYGDDVQPDALVNYIATVEGEYQPAAITVVMMNRSSENVDTEQAPIDIDWEEIGV